jgi:hypothetical protein
MDLYIHGVSSDNHYWLIVEVLTIYYLPLSIFFNLFQIIKLITFTTSGGAYLNFMGNEFAHPKVS